MKPEVEKAIERYQCSGCTNGSDTSCCEQYNNDYGVGCKKHSAGTFIFGIGRIFLGLPKGFNRVGPQDKMEIHIFEKFDEEKTWMGNHPKSKYNIPCWKYLNEHGHTLVRGLHPRTNMAFLKIFLEDCRDQFNCYEVTNEDIEYMD